MDDVLPFLRNVVKGRNVPDARLQSVVKQYELFDGVSPLNDQCRALKKALEQELASAEINLPVYWGNRNWHPFLADAVEQMQSDGKKNALVFVTSAFSSYSGCRQYRQNLAEAMELASDINLQKLRLFYNHPGFIEPLAENLRNCSNKASQDAQIVFTAHSIPLSMAAVSNYEEQLNEAASLVMDAAGLQSRPFALVFQSRSGPPHIPWLEPDIVDHLTAMKESGLSSAVVVPLGFTSDHMEVLFDLDTQAAQTAAKLDIEFVRVPTVGTAPRYVAMIRELIEEQLHGTQPLAVGSLGPWPDQCPEGHCLVKEKM